MRYKKSLATGLLVVLMGASIVYASKVGAPNPTQGLRSKSAVTKPATAQPADPPAGFDKSLHPIDQPGSPWWIVNKTRSLPAGYVPSDLAVPNVRLRLGSGSEQMQLSQSIIPEVQSLFAAAETAGHPLIFASGYRSEAYQLQLYQGYIARDGQAAADRYSAKPGTSEHQTGLALDVCAVGSACDLSQVFGDTPAGQWLAANAHEYGFIIHYAKGKEAFTGYDYEPWHIRYVGIELATELKNNGQALEEFFGL